MQQFGWLVLALLAAGCVQDLPKSQFKFANPAAVDASVEVGLDADATMDSGSEVAADVETDSAPEADSMSPQDADPCGADVNCPDDDNPCTLAVCDKVNGCMQVHDSESTCDDGNACTVSDKCTAGNCGGAGKTCDDANACTTDSCGDKTGACVFFDNTLACSDGDACTADTCVPATGCKSSVLTCDDGNDCTKDACDASAGCQNSPADGVCNQSYCKTGACVCSEQYVAIDVDVDGVNKIVCAPDYPVWGQRPDSPIDVYQDKNDGTVFDIQTKLTWQKNMNSEKYSWKDGKEFCNQLKLAGETDWRLPTTIELLSLVDYGKPNYGLAIDAGAFPKTPSADFWSAVAHQSNSFDAWFVSFENGYSDTGKMVNPIYVRCVR